MMHPVRPGRVRNRDRPTAGPRPVAVRERVHHGRVRQWRGSVRVVGLLVSSGHRYDGRPGPPSPADSDARDEVQVRAGHGVVGDRYAGHPAHRRAALTLLDATALDAVAAELGVAPFDPLLARRNVVLRGSELLDLDGLRGSEITLDCGAGPVRLLGHRAANPCAWMDTALAPGAHRGMRGRGGLRCEPLSSGRLRLGPARMIVRPPS